MNISPLLCNTLQSDHCLDGFITPEVRSKRRQDMPQYYRINGAIYMLRVCYPDMRFKLYDKDSYAYLMDPQRSVDIDTEYDFFLAEQTMNFNLHKV